MPKKLLLALGLTLVSGCDTEDRHLSPPESPDLLTPAAAPSTGAPAARAEFIDDQGRNIGTALLTQEGHVVRIDIQLAGISGGERAIHIHEVGVCQPPDFESAGDHFDPWERAHGLEHPDGPHGGDLPNLTIAPDGSTRTTLTNELVTLEPGQSNSLIGGNGTAIVIHAGPDDHLTQPAGDSGPRIACGVIEATIAG